MTRAFAAAFDLGFGATFRAPLAAAALAVAMLLAAPAPALQVTQFKQAIAESAAADGGLAEYYRDVGYVPIWTGDDEIALARREAILGVMRLAIVHGLPARRYDADRILSLMSEAGSERDLGRVEVELSRILVRFARDLQSGILTPRNIDSGLVRTVERRSATDILVDFAASDRPASFLRDLAPESTEYSRLLREKFRLEEVGRAGGWGPRVSAASLSPGQSGPDVVALRDRLVAQGYLERTATLEYDAAMEVAVRRFQEDHGLEADGVAGRATMDQVNAGPETRIGSILVAMERERWLPEDRGDRHVWVNLTDFRSRIIDKGAVTFQTRAVVGKNQSGRRTPEFSDVMDHMVINPSWYVPRSIVVGEYLPVLKSNPNALQHMEILDSRGRPPNRAAGFTEFTARNFPFSMRQPPSSRNALGLVKFMFPNQYNIYLHDTPQKHLFSRQVRDFSHGCIRLQDPFDFAYVLLERQSDDPEGLFHRILDTGRETRVDLEEPVQVHLVYRTAYTRVRGGVQYRADIYGRDAKILDALRGAGVPIPGAAG